MLEVRVALVLKTGTCCTRLCSAPGWQAAWASSAACTAMVTAASPCKTQQVTLQRMPATSCARLETRLLVLACSSLPDSKGSRGHRRS